MTRTSWAQRLAPIALALALVAPIRADQPTASEPIQVMSFNIRYGTANDGQNRWENRREMLFALLRAENAALIGVQEALYPPIQELLAAVPGRAIAGRGPRDGRPTGEFWAHLFRTD